MPTHATRNWFAILTAACLLAGCQTSKFTLAPASNLHEYKRASVEIVSEDEFNIGPAIIEMLNANGIVVQSSSTSFSSSPYAGRDKAMRIVYSYTDGWDMTKYLKSFNIQAYDARGHGMLFSYQYHLTGIWRSSSSRIRHAMSKISEALQEPEL